MAYQQTTLTELVNLIGEKFDNSNVPRCCLLIGAGCSFNSQIPLGGGLVDLLKMESFRQQHIIGTLTWLLDKADDYKKQFDTHVDANQLRAEYDEFCKDHQTRLQVQIDNLSVKIRTSKLPLRLQKQSQPKKKHKDFLKEQEGFFEDKKESFYGDAQYEYWFRQYSENASDRQRFVERVIDGKDTGYGYVTLAQLINEGYVRNVFTTNFDDLLHDALMLFFNERVKVYAHSDLSDLLNLRDKKPNVIKLHGDFRYQDMRNTTFEIDETRNRLSEKLADALAETPCFNLVVMGYGGADVSIMNQLLEAKRRKPHSPFRLIWTDRKPVDQLHWRVRDLLDTTPNNFFLQIESFDLLMLQLHEALQLKQVQIVEKAQERQQKINIYYDQMQKQVDEAALTPEQKDALTKSLEASSLFTQAYSSSDFQEQCRLYEQAVQLKPDFAEALVNWGYALSKLGQHEPAIEKYKQVLALKPDFAEALVNWGGALSQLGNYEPAIEKYKQALALKPDDANAWFNLACVYALQGKINETIQVLDIWRTVYKSASPDKLIADTDFDGIRADPAFQVYMRDWAA